MYRARSVRNILVASGLLIGLGGAESAARAAQGKPAAQVKKEAQKVSNAQLVQAMHILNSVKFTLEKADHDYGGHRVAALRDVKAAHHQLNLALHHHHKKGKPPAVVKGAKPATQPEPQALSDKQLADSIPVLEQTIVFLNNANHDYGGHRANAVRDLHAAIKQLKLALKYRQKKTT
jgi:hypothetical protein